MADDYERRRSRELKKEYVFCYQAHCDLDRDTAEILFWATIFMCGIGTIISAFIDRRGFNLQLFLLLILIFWFNIFIEAIFIKARIWIPVPLWWIACIYYSYKFYKISKYRY